MMVKVSWLLQGKSAVDLAWDAFAKTKHPDNKTVAMHLQHLEGAQTL